MDNTIESLTMDARQGNIVSQYTLARNFDEGIGVPSDFKEAAKYYRMAADQGNADAQYQLSTMYKNGDGVPIDGKKYIEYLTMAAEGGCAEAQYRLGAIFHFGGHGTYAPNRDPYFASEWYKKAIDQGHSDALYFLKALQLTYKPLTLKV